VKVHIFVLSQFGRQAFVAIVLATCGCSAHARISAAGPRSSRIQQPARAEEPRLPGLVQPPFEKAVNLFVGFFGGTVRVAG
jgi:hypothetical protein